MLAFAEFPLQQLSQFADESGLAPYRVAGTIELDDDRRRIVCLRNERTSRQRARKDLLPEVRGLDAADAMTERHVGD